MTDDKQAESTINKNRKEASKETIEHNKDTTATLNWADKQSFGNAQKGFKTTLEPLTIWDAEGKRSVWNVEPYLDFEGPLGSPPPPPDTVNPSLWRQATLNNFNGLFEVRDKIYQVRTFDMSNMTIIEGNTGLIIIDPLISNECAASALKLYRDYKRKQGAKEMDVVAVIYTHSHIDHFGGVEGIMPTDEDKKKKVEIYAPDGFLAHAVSENVYAGTAMTRRAQYMYGPFLDQDEKGQVDTGLGKGQSTGTVSLYEPTDVITASNPEDERKGVRVETRMIDGIKVIFHLTPGSEAPAEMDFYFEDLKAFCAAENATHNMHNIQTLRGANVRDALKWSKYLGETIEIFFDDVEVMFASHHWPLWGRNDIMAFYEHQRDMYRYLNDQTLRMLNKGYTGIEIAEVFEMPKNLAEDWSCRGYYGTVNHNAKAVYDKYLGWFDGDPANLHRLPPNEAARKYVPLMGGVDKVIEEARKAAGNGEYRWAAELLRHAVYYDETNEKAKLAEADVLEQMGYQAEAATWRNFFLMGAKELRNGITPVPQSPRPLSFVAAMTIDMIFDSIAAKIVGPIAGSLDFALNWVFTYPDEPDKTDQYLMWIRDGVLNYTKNKQDADAGPPITLSRDTLNQLISGNMSFRTGLRSNAISVTGKIIVPSIFSLILLILLFDTGSDPLFPIVTPRGDANVGWIGMDRFSKTDGGPGYSDVLEEIKGKTFEELLDHPMVAKAHDFIGEIVRGC